MLFASLLLPSLALDAVLRQRPPSSRPFALVHGPAQRRTLLALDRRARAAGLHAGQRLAEAEAICRELEVAEHDPALTRAALELIAAWAYRYSSDVRLDPPRAVALEVGRSLRLFGPWPRLEARLRRELAALGFRHRIAVAPNPRAARVLARVDDGALVTAAGDLPQALARVPVACAGLPETAVSWLTSVGLRRLDQVLPLPRAALQRRAGKALVEELAVLLGERPDPLAAYRPRDRFDARIDFGCEVKHVHGLLFALRRVLDDLATFVLARDAGVARFELRLIHADAAPTDLSLGLLAPERDARALFEVAKLRLERVRLPAPVLELELHAADLPSFVPAGGDLLDQRATTTLAWPQLAERLRARLGEGALYGLGVDADPRPERACVRGTGGGTVDRQLPPRPTWLLARPILLRDPAPRILAGPERLETGWWDGDDIRRDYYVLELASGQRAWAFCAPGEPGAFMLHGWFA